MPSAVADRRPVPAVARDTDLAAARTMVKVLDRYGVDPILGFFLPGAGDILGAALGVYLVVIAGQRKVSPIVIARMFLNLTIDLLIGAVPVAGDLADLVYQANKKNLALIEDSANRGGKGTTKDWLAVVGAGLLCLGVLVGVVWLATMLLRWIF